MRRRSSLSVVLLSLLALVLVACARAVPSLRTATASERPGQVAPHSEKETQHATLDGAAASDLYGIDEALRDVLSGPLTHIGTGAWPGDGRMPACVFRNERVIVVNAYCSLQETQAFRVQVYSPTRGRVVIYAESKTPLSAHMRQQYFTFTAQTEPLPGPDLSIAPLHLEMGLGALRQYEERRYEAYLPVCYGGVELGKPQSGCLGSLAGRASEWPQQNRLFLDQGSSEWYLVVRALRSLASKHGRDPD